MSSRSAVSLRVAAAVVGLDFLFDFAKFSKDYPKDFHWQECVLFCAVSDASLFICSLLLHSVQEPGMQGVQISDSGQQVDAGAGTNGGVHSVVHHPQTAAVALHPGGQEQVCRPIVEPLNATAKSPVKPVCLSEESSSIPLILNNI